MFSKLCDDNDETYNHLLLHTEVRWKSKGNCLVRFHELYSSILEHVETINVKLHGEPKNIKYDLAYLSDIFDILISIINLYKVIILYLYNILDLSL